jgi:hypothetical protein
MYIMSSFVIFTLHQTPILGRKRWDGIMPRYRNVGGVYKPDPDPQVLARPESRSGPVPDSAHKVRFRVEFK